MSRRRTWMISGLLLASAAGVPLLAQQVVQSVRAFPEAQAHQPTPIPDRIVLSWTGDPTRSQAVAWRTDTTVTQPAAEIGLADGDPNFRKSARRVPAHTNPLTTDLGEAKYHWVNFDGLQPATQYAYRVGDGVNWSEWIHFRTASDRPEPFSFIYFGDAQNDVKSMWSRVIRDAYSEAPRARFIIHAGDLINRANRDAEWGDWFYAGGWINAMVPSIPTPGNHEYDRVPGTTRRALSRHWRPQFALPENGPEGLEETVYSIDYQGLRVISLNSNERQAEQVAWLEEKLRNNPNRWTVVTFHHPMYSTAKGRDNAELRKLWNPVLEKYRVDLVLQGHDHTYARSNLRTGMSLSEAQTGTVYVVSVSGPKMYNLEREPWMERAAEDLQLYQVITVDGDALRYEARTATGSLYDAFELRKRKGRTNRLVDRAPKTPEHLRTPAPAAAGQ